MKLGWVGWRNLEGGSSSSGMVLRLPVELGTSRLAGGGGFQTVLLCNVNFNHLPIYVVSEAGKKIVKRAKYLVGEVGKEPRE